MRTGEIVEDTGLFHSVAIMAVVDRRDYKHSHEMIKQ